MTAEHDVLLQEATASLEAAAGVTPLARDLLLDRRRLLPYVVLGGTGVGLIAGLVAGAVPPNTDDARGVLVIGAGFGVPVGMIVGWSVQVLAARVLAFRRPSGWQWTALRAGLSVPAHLTAGLAAAFGVAATGAGFGPIVERLGGIVTTLLLFEIVLLPLNLAFARGRAPIRSTSLRGAIDETARPMPSATGCSRTALLATTAIVMLVVASFVVLAALALAQSIAPTAYATAFDRFGGAIGVLLLLAWLGLIVLGTKVVARFLSPRR